MRLMGIVSSLALAVVLPTALSAQTPPPLGTGLFGIPGFQAAPAGGATAGLSFSDRWLGAGPIENPAAGPGSAASVTPLMFRVNRQDLRADHHYYDEKAAFLSAESIWIRWGGSDRIRLAAYASQPLLRQEENAFERGDRDGPTPPSIVGTRSAAHEQRAGIAVSTGGRRLRIGAAGEWTRRDDEYHLEVAASTTDAGVSDLAFSGGAPGFALGARYDFGDRPGSSITVGGAVRYLPSIGLDGTVQVVSVILDTSYAVAAERASGWEGGVSTRVPLGPAFALHLSVGGRTEQVWEGFAFQSGAVIGGALGGEYHDAAEPWTFRFGFGRERQPGAPEPHASLFGIGFGWNLGSSRLDIGAMRRSLERSNHPRSYDDRLLGSLTVRL